MDVRKHADNLFIEWRSGMEYPSSVTMFSTGTLSIMLTPVAHGASEAHIPRA